MVYILAVLLLLYTTDQVTSQCPSGQFRHSDKCYDCYYTCRVCGGGICQRCASQQCSLCTTSCTSSPCISAYCSNCIAGYYLTSGSNCYQCAKSGCVCTSKYDCPKCLPGKYGTICQYPCPDDCKNHLCSKTYGQCVDGCISGKYGRNCQFTCSDLCINSVCDQDGGACTIGCVDGYYSDLGVCQECPYKNRCVKCISSTKCTECKPGKRGNTCQLDCQTGCKDNICDIYSGICSRSSCEDGFYFYSGDRKCYSCRSSRCSSCSDANSCDTCTPSQHWGSYCQYSCDNCASGCNKGNGCSISCQTGYYRRHDALQRGYVCERCPEPCSSCISLSVCNSCKAGFANKDAYHKCECEVNICTDRSGSKCMQCPSPGWYPSGSACCPCHSNCKDNVCLSNGICTECADGKYGNYCQNTCYWACVEGLCYRDGTCISCPDTSKYGKYCNNRCNQRIWGCATCLQQGDTSVICLKCVFGYYVDNNQCTPCNDNCKAGRSPVCNSTTGSCSYGCKIGFVGEKCEASCHVSNCQSCSAAELSACSLCKDGFYLETVNNCSECPANCKTGTQCDAYNGTCIDGCSDFWSGQQCNKPCPQRCQRCEQSNSSVCGVCKIGFYGDGCEANCSPHCQYKDNIQVCNKYSGHCKFGCNDGFWDYKCHSVCGPGCNRSSCNMTTGTCLYGCINRYFGKECKAECSIHCKESETLPGRICDELYGYCLKGCTPGWFGESCAAKCSDQCNGTVCSRKNGTCTFGCIDGYVGPNCTQAIVSDSEFAANVEAIGAGAGTGVGLVLAAVLIVGVFLWRRRRMSSKLDTNDSGMENVSPDYREADLSLVYSNIDDTGTGIEGSSNTGVSNMLYANVRMSDLSTEKDTNTTYELARPISEDFLKEEEIIDGELAEELETNAGEVDDTYYNVTGKRVAVANLPEYIRKQSCGDIYADFQRIPKGLLKDYKEAKRAKNIHKNKYRSIYPYDESRVILRDGGSDYMNASYIEGYNSKREYIASSGPFKKRYDTTPDFWRMIWQEKCENIVMLTNPVENEETKCIKYWPDQDGHNNFGSIQVTTLTEDRYSDFTIRIFTVTKGDESFNVRHLHFTAWPDKGVPHDVTSMIEFRQKVRSLHKDKDCPLLVHCSAGIGRTGTFIALDMLTYEGEDRGSVDIFGCVAALRSQRCNMVQTMEQYDYLHHAVLHSLTFDCRSIAGDMFLQNYNKLIERNGGKRIIDIQFQHLQSTTDEMTDEDKGDALRNQSLPNKNREGADIPVDECRVKLHENRKPGAIDYINAVWMNGFRTRHKFIVAQTPLPSTVVDFLTLVHQEKCSCVVMMEETDISNKSVGVYWPADNQSIKHGVFKISCKDSSSTQHYAKKSLSISCHGSKGEDIHDVHLFIFTKWSKGNAVPNSSDSVLQLVKAVDTVNRSKDKESTVLVHCMTGSERSCVYCAVSVLIEKMEVEHEVSVVNTLRQIKARRRSAFSSLDQYKFCHQAVISYLQSFDTYSNFGLRDSEASSV